MLATVPSFVDQIRALVNERASLVSQRVEIDGRVSLLDAQLAEVRQLLGVAPASDPPRPVVSVGAPKPVVAPEDRRAEILALLKGGPRPTREIARSLDLDRLVCKMALQRMQKVGLIGRVGVKNGQKWTLTRIADAIKPAPAAAATPLLRSKDVNAAFIEARDATVLAKIEHNNGVATIQELRKWFVTSAVAGSGTDAVKHEALQNALLRLKAKHQLARTGDTWSIVGAGVARG